MIVDWHPFRLILELIACHRQRWGHNSGWFRLDNVTQRVQTSHIPDAVCLCKRKTGSVTYRYTWVIRLICLTPTSAPSGVQPLYPGIQPVCHNSHAWGRLVGNGPKYANGRTAETWNNNASYLRQSVPRRVYMISCCREALHMHGSDIATGLLFTIQSNTAHDFTDPPHDPENVFLTQLNTELPETYEQYNLAGST